MAEEKPTVKNNKLSFDPEKQMTKLKGKDYLEVKWRLVWFRDIHPDGSITTDHVHIDENSAIFRATVKTGSGGESTGYGSETKKDFGDFIEKAETKAIGRALAALGFGTQFAPELEEGARIVDSPVDRRQSNPDPTPWQQQGQPPQGSRGSTPAKASDKQLNWIRGLWKELGYTAVDQEGVIHHDATSLGMYAETGWGVPFEQMNKEQAGQMLDALQAKKAEVDQGPGEAYVPDYKMENAPF